MSLSVIQPRLLHGVPPTELDLIVERHTRSYVLYNMPIRMLEFNQDGSNIKLIERDDIFRTLRTRVQARITSERFQRRWEEALRLQDISFANTPRSDRMNKLVTNAVSKVASYAILSHTWIGESPGEVVFSTWNTRSHNDRGWTKVRQFCRVAADEYNMTLGWIDSVCINKDSSSELAESIRSMYKWYRASRVCITYLSQTDALGDSVHDSWFTRGWTLQELLAPTKIAFYNRYWEALGTDSTDAITSLISAETTITGEELAKCRSGHKDQIPVNRIFQMASQRQVTREEDSSYSLLGLLNVNISVAHGEGEQSAFRRLFHELLATRKHVLDLFNRQYITSSDSLVPLSLKKYYTSSRNFDILNHYLPPEPITLTHLGVRCQWLLLPALAVKEQTSDGTYIQIGQYSAQIPLSVILEDGDELGVVHNLMDSRLYGRQSDYAHPLSRILPHTHIQTTYAVPTFALKEDVLTLPEYLMAIRFYTPDRPGTVLTGSEIHILGTNCPAWFQLLDSTGGVTRGIHINDLKRNGMQLATLFI